MAGLRQQGAQDLCARASYTMPLLRWQQLGRAATSGRIPKPHSPASPAARPRGAPCSRPDLVVARQAVDARLDQDEPELGVLVLAVALHVLAHGHGLLDEVVKVLGDLGREAVALEDAQHLGAGDVAHLRDAVLVAQQHADLGGGHALARQLADVLGHLRTGWARAGGGGEGGSSPHRFRKTGPSCPQPHCWRCSAAAPA